MKKLFYIIMFCLSALILSSCVLKYFDNLGGGGTADNTAESGEIVLPDQEEEITTSELNSEGATKVDLSTVVTTTNYKFENNVLSFSKDGTYELSGSLSGTIEVPKKNVNLILAGVTITPLDSQYTGALVYKKENTNALILTVKEGTTNTIYDSVNNVESYNADADEGIIVVKSSTTVSINGKGTLNLISNSTSSSGIKVKNTALTIDGTTLNITASKNGIKGGNKVLINNANITINSGNDGIKTDAPCSSADECTASAADLYAGYIHIVDSDIDITSVDDGICADTYLHIYNSTHTITVKTNGGAPTTVTERSSDHANGKAIKVGGITLESGTTETDYKSTTDYGYFMLLESGNFNINSNDDAIHSKGNLQISNGNYTIATGDDGIHADYLTKIIGGTININKSYEGIEGATVEILDGTINVNASDDGINAANGDLKNYNFNLYIGGGSIMVNCQGDGVDTNGTIEFKGGTTVIYGPTANDNAALDADNGILMNGGTLIAIGSKGMAEIPATNSSQYCVGYNLDTTQKANTNITFTVNGTEKINVTAPKTFSSVVVSSAGLTKGDKIVLTVGSTSKSATLSSTITTFGNLTSTQPFGGGGNQPFGGGGGQPGGRR